MSPILPLLNVTNNDVITFVVTAVDDDGDPLSFSWTSINYTVVPTNTNFLEVMFEVTSWDAIEIHVDVSDGDDSTATMWRVIPTPEPEVGPMEPGGVSIVLAAILLLLVVLITSGSILLYQNHQRGKD